MKKVVFSKYSNERSVLFQIRTDILKDTDGKLTVTKSATTKEAKAHIAHNELCAKRLEESYADTGFFACPCMRVDDKTLEFAFLDGGQLDYLLDEALRKDDKDAFWRLLDRYKAQMEKLACVDFELTPEFENVFGNTDNALNVVSGKWNALLGEKALPIANVDQIFQNIKIQDDQWFVFDYEWTFDFAIPVKYVFYRAALFYGEFDRKSYLEGKGIDLFSFFAITKEDKALFADMEDALQGYILGEHTRLWEMYEIMKPNNFDSIALADEEKRRQNRRKVIIRRNYEDGRVEEDSIDASVDEAGKSMVDIPVSANIQTLNVVLGNDTCVVRFYNMSLRRTDGTILMADKPFLSSGTMIRTNVYQFADDVANLFLNELEDGAVLHIEYEVGFGQADLMEMSEKELHETESRMQAEIDALRQENARLSIENEALRVQSAQYLNDYNTIVNSAAWKSTKPLRAMADRMKGK